VKPPPLARVAYQPADLVTADDTTPEHARACAELVEKIGGVLQRRTVYAVALSGGRRGAGSHARIPGGLGGANWGGTAFDPASRLLLVATQDVGALGSIEKAKAGSPLPYEKTTPGRATFDVRIGDTNLPCQKPPWGRLTAINTSTGDFAWQVPLGITEQLPPEKQNTGRPVLAGPIITASGLVFIASTDDNRFRALDLKTGREMWVAKLPRRGNADPITYQGKGRQAVRGGRCDRHADGLPDSVTQPATYDTNNTVGESCARDRRWSRHWKGDLACAGRRGLRRGGELRQP
jgi:quinoprotein glucose dehydrogenase